MAARHARARSPSRSFGAGVGAGGSVAAGVAGEPSAACGAVEGSGGVEGFGAVDGRGDATGCDAVLPGPAPHAASASAITAAVARPSPRAARLCASGSPPSFASGASAYAGAPAAPGFFARRTPPPYRTSPPIRSRTSEGFNVRATRARWKGGPLRLGRSTRFPWCPGLQASCALTSATTSSRAATTSTVGHGGATRWRRLGR